MKKCPRCGKTYDESWKVCFDCSCALVDFTEENNNSNAYQTPKLILKKANGVNGQIEIYKDKVIIKRAGMLSFLTHGLKGEKTILIKQISSIQFKKAGGLTNGYIQFAFLGGQEAKHGIWEATADENSLMFNTNQQRDFEEARSLVENIMLNYDSKNMAGASSSIQDLEKLGELKQKGIITEEEFMLKKKQILSI